MNTVFKTACLLAMLVIAPMFCICDTNNASINDSNLVEELLLLNYAEEQLHLSAAQYATLSQTDKANLRALGLGSWFRVIWNSIFGESKQWGQYREPGHRDEGPYMTFQYNEYSDLQYGVDTIRNRIVNKAYGYDKLYYEIFKTARDGQTVNCTYKDEVCKNANLWFIYVL